MTGAVLNPITSRAVGAIVDLIARERLLTLAVNRPDGWPQATTVGYLSEGLNLYVMVARTSQKLANLTADNRASVAIRAESGAHGDGVGLSMAGRVMEVTDPVLIERLNRQAIERLPGIHVYCPTEASTALLHFRPCVVSAVGVIDGQSHAETFSVGTTDIVARLV